MSELRQIAAVCLIGIGSLRERYGSALVVVVGMACVVGVLTSMLSLTAGLTRAYFRPEDAIALSVSVERKTDYDLRIAGANTAFFTRMAYVIGAIMGLGALFGIVKIMYGAVRARTREIGTLRAIGFGATPVVMSVLAEAALLGAIGALLGSAIAWLIFDGRDMWVWGAFKLRVSPALWLLGLEWALITSLLGGLFPALRAGGLPPSKALRIQ
jgi:putative ABC transport system permease protein